MSSSEDKQFEPSSRKRKKAQEDGQIARSRELTQALQLSVCFLLLLMAPLWGHGILDLYHKIIQDVDTFDARNIEAQIADAGSVITWTLCIWFGSLSLISLVSEFSQVGEFKLSFKHVAPKFSRLNPLKGFLRILGEKDGQKPPMGLVIEVIQIALIGGTVLTVLWFRVFVDADRLFESEISDATMALSLVKEIVMNLLRDLLVLSLAYGVFRYVQSRLRIRKQLMMNFEEVKRESKEDEGDPHLKGQRKSLHQEVLLHGMIENVKKAKVVVVSDS